MSTPFGYMSNPLIGYMYPPPPPQNVVNCREIIGEICIYQGGDFRAHNVRTKPKDKSKGGILIKQLIEEKYMKTTWLIYATSPPYPVRYQIKTNSSCS